MAVLGSLLKKAIGGYASKPKVPDFVPVDATAEQGAAIAGNIANLPGAQKLAEQTNAFNLEQLQKMLAAIIPGYNEIQGKQSQIVQSMMRGEIPKDVQAAVTNQAASKAIAGGFGGTGAHRNLVARDFGTTSYDITQQGMDSAQRWLAQTAAMAAPSMMNVTSMFLTPAQRIQHSVNERNNKFNVDWTRNQVKSMPDPWKQALGDAFIQEEYEIGKAIGSIVGMAAGGCWVAREVYGEGDISWKLYRQWLFNMAPKWFKKLYLRFGERFAAWISDKPKIKALIRKWMDGKVELAYGRIISRA
jgi:hypothetical protein